MKPAVTMLGAVPRAILFLAVMLLLCLASASAAPPPRTIPSRVLYKHFLDHVAAFRYEADSLDSQGLDGNIFRFYFQKKLNLSLQELEQVQGIALDYSSAMQENRNRARAIILAFRTMHFPNGSLLPGTTPPPPPSN